MTRIPASYYIPEAISRFNKFRTIFFEEFYSRDDGGVQIDGAKLAKLFKRYFKSGQYPSLDELRETASSLPNVFPQAVGQAPGVLENLERSFKTALDACKRSSKVKKVPPEVSLRRGVVQAVAKSNPNSKGKDLDLLTCEELDKFLDILERWRKDGEIETWTEGYEHPKVKPLIHKMFSDDRKKKLTG